jgi:hypothetical protein
MFHGWKPLLACRRLPKMKMAPRISEAERDTSRGRGEAFCLPAERATYRRRRS